MTDDTSGDTKPDYKWVGLRKHWEETGGKFDEDGNRVPKTGIRPDQWCDYQSIWGDNVDGIKGVHGIGEKGAKTLIQEFETLEGVMDAAREGDDRITEKKQLALLEFEINKMEVTRKLVTLRIDLDVPQVAKLAGRSEDGSED